MNILSSVSPDFSHKVGEVSIVCGRLEHVMLVVLMRLRNVPIKAAYTEYVKTTVGVKLHGVKSSSSEANMLPCLSSFYNDHPALKSVGKKISKLIEKRNMLVHGLIIETSNSDSSENAIIIYNDKKYNVDLTDLDKLISGFMSVIEELNAAVPTGLSVEWASCGSINTWQTNAFMSD